MTLLEVLKVNKSTGEIVKHTTLEEYLNFDCWACENIPSFNCQCVIDIMTKLDEYKGTEISEVRRCK